MKSNYNYDFSKNARVSFPRTKFHIPSTHKTSFAVDYLIPIYNDEVLPGDTISMSIANVMRIIDALKSPYMDNLFIDIHAFFVPFRLLWNDFKKFFGVQETFDTPATTFLFPRFKDGTTLGRLDHATSVSSPQYLSNYLGITPFYGTNVNVALNGITSMYHRAYNLIWNDWYRDENLQSRSFFDSSLAQDDLRNFVLRKRGKRKDYFTSALPRPQKGNSPVLNLSGELPVYLKSTAVSTPSVFNYFPTSPAIAGVLPVIAKPLTGNSTEFILTDSPDKSLTYDPAGSLVADLVGANGFDINQLREAFQVQRFLERSARGGTRFFEILNSQFGVVNPDSLLQRPEFLGSQSATIYTSLVSSTSSTTNQPLGTLGAYGVSGNKGFLFSKSFGEPGVLMVLMSTRSDLTYQQGIERRFFRSGIFDFYFPVFQGLGEQAILNREIAYTGVGTKPTSTAPGTGDYAVFGYQEHWSDYVFKKSLVTGVLNSEYANPLDFWHLAQDFSSVPVLNSSFIEENSPVSRVMSVVTEGKHHFIADFFFDCYYTRVMPPHFTPGGIDHF